MSKKQTKKPKANQKQYEANSNVYNLMKEMISEIEDFHPIVEGDIVDHIAIVMKEVKPPKDPEKQVIVGKTAKAPPVMEALGKEDWKFVITLNAGEWGQYTPKQKRAELDHQLSHMVVSVNDDGETKCSLRKPDVVGFEGEIKRHGFWRNKVAKSAVEDLFEEEDDD